MVKWDFADTNKKLSNSLRKFKETCRSSTINDYVNKKEFFSIWTPKIFDNPYSPPKSLYFHFDAPNLVSWDKKPSSLVTLIFLKIPRIFFFLNLRSNIIHLKLTQIPLHLFGFLFSSHQTYFSLIRPKNFTLTNQLSTPLLLIALFPHRSLCPLPS